MKIAGLFLAARDVPAEGTNGFQTQPSIEQEPSSAHKPRSLWGKLVSVSFLLPVFALLSVSNASAANRFSVATGNWNSNSTWSATSGGAGGASFPVAGDVVTVENGFNVTITAAAACSSLTLIASATTNGTTSQLTIGAFTLTISGAVSMGSDVNGNTRSTKILLNNASSVLDIGGNLTIGNGGGHGMATVDLSNGANTATTLKVAGSLTRNLTDGMFTPGTGSTVDFTGTAAGQTIDVTNFTYANIQTDNTNASGATPGAQVTSSNVTGSISVATGTFNNGGFAITLAAGKNFSVSNGATFNLTGTTTMVAVSGGGTKTFGATSTVDYGGAAQTVTAETYGHLTLSGSSTKTMPGTTTTVAGDFTTSGTASATAGAAINTSGKVTLGSGSTFNASTFTHAVGGDWANNGGTFTPSTSTITFNGTGAQAINGTAASQTFKNVVLTKTAGPTFSVSGSSTP